MLNNIFDICGNTRKFRKQSACDAVQLHTDADLPNGDRCVSRF